jgi:hypothetical protein
MRAICPDHLILIDFLSERNYEALHYAFLSTPVGSSLLSPNILLSTLLSNTLSLCSVPNVQTKFHTRKTAALIYTKRSVVKQNVYSCYATSWENIKMNLREVGWGHMDWIHLVQNRDT